MNNKITDFAMEKSAILTVLELRLIKEYFNTLYTQNGLGLEWSLLVLDNKKQFEFIDNIIETKLKILNLLPNENTEEFLIKSEELIARYIDRDDQGEPIFNEDGAPQITEMMVEYNEELNKLKDAYPEASSYSDEQHKKALMEKIECNLIIPKNFSDIPKEMPPIVLEVFEKLY